MNGRQAHVVLLNFSDPNTTPSFLTEYLALGYLASALRHAGHRVTWIDEHAGGRIDPGTFDFAACLPADIVGVSPSFATYRRALRWLEEWKRRDPAVLTVAGGQHVMMVPEEVLRESDAVDFVCLGEGEVPLGTLADAYQRGKARPTDVPGMAWRQQDRVVWGHHPELGPTMDDLPFPARDTLQKWVRQRRVSQVSLQNSRGCPYNCKFCHFPQARRRGYGYDHRFRSPGNVLHEMVDLQATYGFREFFFNSPQFLSPGPDGRRWALEFAEQVTASRRDFRLEFECRSDLLTDPALVGTLARAGLVRVFLGLESGSELTLRRYGKGIPPDLHRTTVALLRGHGIAVSGSGFIMFHPFSSLEELRRNAEFLWELRETHVHSLWSFFRMFPSIAENASVERAGLAETGRKHDDVMGYLYQDLRVARVVRLGPRGLRSPRVERARRLVRLVDIEIGLEEANLPAVADPTGSELAGLLEVRDTSGRVREAVVAAFFDHFLQCLRLASREASDPEWEAAGRRLDRCLSTLQRSIDGLLARHDRLFYGILRKPRGVVL